MQGWFPVLESLVLLLDLWQLIMFRNHLLVDLEGEDIHLVHSGLHVGFNLRACSSLLLGIFSEKSRTLNF